MFTLGVIRLVVLVVNGWWPLSHSVRRYLSIAFLFFVWLPLASCFWWNVLVDAAEGVMKTYPGFGFSMLALGLEFLIFYAHSTFVYITAQEVDGG